MIKSRINKSVIAISIVFIFIAFMISINRYSKYLKVKTEWQNNKLALEDVQKEILEIQLSLEKYEKEKSEFKEYLFNEQDVPSFLEGISQYAQKASINIVDMKTKKFQEVVIPNDIEMTQSVLEKRRRLKNKVSGSQESEADKNFSLVYLPISVMVEGDFWSFVQFLSYLEEFKQLLLVSDVKMASSREYPKLKCNFTIKIFSLRDLNE
ncbi:MAG: hypothetical protein KKF78_00390 [Candidatus Omnitrophica bacterium]|nr:hypothetical protein [Candidatus Omnitrophota bacterium]MBU1995594.1 hypothetical protein [Candidatus Omnitrophota bacterium]